VCMIVICIAIPVMTNLIIASFQDEAQAIEASRRLSQLESFGDITIYERVIVKKNSNGTVEVIHADIMEGMRTISGLSLGTLVGTLGGPVGMAVGMLSGVGAEANYFGLSEEFASKVMSKMKPGGVCIIAELDEDNPVYINGTVGGEITRASVDYEYDAYAEAQIEVIDELIAVQRARIKSAINTEKSIIQQKIVDLREKRRRRLAALEREAKESLTKGKSGSFPAGDKARWSHHEFKISRLRKKIERHQAILEELKNELQRIESRV